MSLRIESLKGLDLPDPPTEQVALIPDAHRAKATRAQAARPAASPATPPVPAHDPARAALAHDPARAAAAVAAGVTGVPLEVEAVYRVHAATVARWAARLAGPSFDVEDLVQEVFLHVKRMLPRFRGEAQITTWLYRITQGVVAEQRRKQRWRRWLSGSAEDVAGRLASDELGPAEALERRQSAELVYEVLESLADKYRTVLILHEIEGLDAEAIGALTGAKPETIWVWLHRARQKFIACVKKRRQRELARQCRLPAQVQPAGVDGGARRWP